ncbi:MAG TPA: glycosyltransferase family 2 protein [Tepidisphaeraceae bacterium]|nr:glycosyltransferase family 2 protein [Tepidisphaeraceae bacterium]
MISRALSVSDLPSPPSGKTGWPWTESSPPVDATQSTRRITIVTPSFNQGAYLEETIRSVLLQGYLNLQYIIVDGGSRDDSVDIIRKYEKHLAWWVSEKDKGHTDALNKGFARADGEIHAFINSDDFYERGALHAAVRAISTEHPWVVGQVRYLNEEGKTWPLPVYPERSIAPWFLHCPIAQPGAFWLADIHRRIGKFREDLKYFFDYEFWMRLRFDLDIPPHVIADPIAVYRLHARSKTVAENHAFLAEARSIRSVYEPRLNFRQRISVGIARHHKRASRFGSRAKADFAAGRRLAGVGHMLGGFLRWPPLLMDRRVRGAMSRMLMGRRAVPIDEPPVVWNYYDE